MSSRRAFLALWLCLGTLAPPAAAEITRPAQFDMANAVGLAYTGVPPPVIRRVCLVDSGVTPNADTGRVIATRSVDGVPGEDSDAAGRHGTSMAMHMGAEANGRGTVGVWPLGEILSYRVTRVGREIGFADYSRAISACAEDPSVGVVNLSLVASSSATPDERRRLADVLADARSQEIVVVAAAGNDGDDVGSPADDLGVLAVAASGPGAAACPFASHGPEVDLTAPGCGLHGASPFDLSPLGVEGSSFAAAMSAQVIAALRSYRPELGVAEVEAALREQAVLDVEGLFREHGLGHVIDDGMMAAPARTVFSQIARFPRPRLKRFRIRCGCRRRQEFVARRCREVQRPYRRQGATLLLQLRNPPAGALLEVRTRRVRWIARRPSRRIRVTPPRGWRRLAVRYVPSAEVSTLPSSTVFIRHR